MGTFVIAILGGIACGGCAAFSLVSFSGRPSFLRQLVAAMTTVVGVLFFVLVMVTTHTYKYLEEKEKKGPSIYEQVVIKADTLYRKIN